MCVSVDISVVNVAVGVDGDGDIVVGVTSRYDGYRYTRIVSLYVCCLIFSLAEDRERKRTTRQKPSQVTTGC